MSFSSISHLCPLILTFSFTLLHHTMLGTGGSSAVEGYHGPAEAGTGLLWDRMGYRSQVYLLLLLSSGGPTEGGHIARGTCPKLGHLPSVV